jgi:uncharacterized membrane protein
VVIHFVFDLVELYALVEWEYPGWFSFVMNWGGVLFLLISGVSATLGHRSVRRGLIVLACGFVCTAVTYGMYRMGMADYGIIIYFGALHCLGVCMILWPLFRKLPVWALAALGAVIAGVGLWTMVHTFPVGNWLIPLGFAPETFRSSDYFPLLPYLGFFLLGAAFGRTAYREKKSLLPGVSEKNPAVRFLSLCGKHSLWIYLIHQPLLSAVFYVILLLK